MKIESLRLRNFKAFRDVEMRDQVQMALDNISACQNISLVFNKAPKWQKLASDYYYYYGNERSAGNSVTP